MSRTQAIPYAPVPGTPALRDAVAKKLGEYHGRKFDRAEVMVSCGAKHSLANLFLATLDPGDEVIIPAPYWVSYPDMVLLAEGTPVFVPCPQNNGFKLVPEELEPAEERYRIVKTKRFDMKPMTPEEAALQMDLLGHDFYFFNNAETGRTAVVYRRSEGDVGLIDASA